MLFHTPNPIFSHKINNNLPGEIKVCAEPGIITIFIALNLSLYFYPDIRLKLVFLLYIYEYISFKLMVYDNNSISVVK